MSFCVKCGAPQSEDAVTCTVCGAELRQSPEPWPGFEARREQRAGRQKTRPARRSHAPAVRALLAVLLGLVVLLAAASLRRLLPVAGSGGTLFCYTGVVRELDAPTGTSSLLLTLSNGWRVMTGSATRCFDAADGSVGLPRWSDFAPGDRITVWVGSREANGCRPAFCILQNADGGAYSGAYMHVKTVEQQGDALRFTSAGYGAAVTVSRADVSDTPERLSPGAGCFVWYGEKTAGAVTAQSVYILNDPKD